MSPSQASELPSLCMRTEPIELEVFQHLLHAVAEERGAALRRTAFSPNIKERRDYSGALLDAASNVLGGWPTLTFCGWGTLQIPWDAEILPGRPASVRGQPGKLRIEGTAPPRRGDATFYVRH
jgi:hypothetical protein